MNISWLQDFLTLAASGNFTRAAEQRHMTQPAFSRRIRLLEEWLGVTLVDRSTQPALLTESGEWFRTVATDVLARIAAIPGARRLVGVAVTDIFPNCPRYIPDLAGGAPSAYLPQPDGSQIPPEWKGRDYIRDILPRDDPHRV